MTRSDTSSACGVIVSSLFGSGKSSVVEEIADLLEDALAPHGALDLDWLWWFGVPRIQRHEALRVLFDNLTFVADAYLDAGVTRFVLAWSLRDPSDLAGVRAALPLPGQGGGVDRAASAHRSPAD